MFDVTLLTETWGKDKDNAPTFICYQSFCLNRATRRGGGVMLLMKEDMQCELFPDFCVTCDDFEIVTARARKCMFSVWPPDPGSFFCFYEKLLRSSSENLYLLVSAGDFDIDVLGHSASQQNMDTLNVSIGFSTAIASPTRITEKSSTLLHLFITNININSIFGGVLSQDISDHLPIFLLIKKCSS